MSNDGAREALLAEVRDVRVVSVEAVDDIDMTPHLRMQTLASAIGCNELAKLSKTLDEKAYHRFARDLAVKSFVEYGGNDDLFATEDTLVTIEVPGGPPHIIFRERDIELMRDTVKRYDARWGSTSATVRCWVCRHDVPEVETVCMAGVGTSCRDGSACRARLGGDVPGTSEALRRCYCAAPDFACTKCGAPQPTEARTDYDQARAEIERLRVAMCKFWDLLTRDGKPVSNPAWLEFRDAMSAQKRSNDHG